MSTGGARKSSKQANRTHKTFPETPRPSGCGRYLKTLAVWCSLLFSVAFLSSCRSEKAALLVIAGRTMGTTFTVKIAQDQTAGKLPDKRLLDIEINDLLTEVNRQMSTYLEDSEISRFNKSSTTDWFPVSEDFARVTVTALKVSEESNGAFDITVAPLVNLWGFGPEKRATLIPDDREIDERKHLVGYHHISLRMAPPSIRKTTAGMSCDLSAIAKGFGVDKIARYLEEKGIRDYMVEIGGEVRTRGVNARNKQWRIGLRSPEGNSLKKIIRMSGTSMATSGDYANYLEVNGIRYSHTIDPRTGRPIRHQLASVSVIHPSCMMADALATAINVMGPQEGYDFAVRQQLPVYMIVRTNDGFVEKMSPEFTAYTANLKP